MEQFRHGNDKRAATKILKKKMKDYKYTINGKKYEVTIGDFEDNAVNVRVNGEDFKVEMEPKEEEAPKVTRPAPQQHIAPKPTDEQNEAAVKKAKLRDALKAPLPGVIKDITVNIGDEVKEGDTCVVLEAMKMANNLEAERSGKVTAILVTVGQSVMEGDPLVTIE